MTVTYLSFVAYRFCLRCQAHWAIGAAVAGAAATPVLSAVISALCPAFMPHARTLGLGKIMFDVGSTTVTINVLVNALSICPPGFENPRDWPRGRMTGDRVQPAVPAIPDEESPFIDALPALIGQEAVSIRADDHTSSCARRWAAPVR